MTILSAAGIALAAGLAVATPASADPSSPSCEGGSICFYHDTNYTGAWFKTTSARIDSFSSYTYFPYGVDSVNDTVSSIINNTGHWAVPSRNANQGGGYIIVNNSVPNLKTGQIVYNQDGSKNGSTSFNDVISSYYLY